MAGWASSPGRRTGPASRSPRRSTRRGGSSGRSPASGSTDKDSPRARRIDRIDWRWDEEGHLDRWSHLWVVDLERGAMPRQVTSGDWGVSDIAWHPDGRTVVFASDRGPHADLAPRSTIWAVDVDAPGDAGDRASRSEVLAPGGAATKPAVSPDGRWVAAIGVLDAEPRDDISPTVLVAPVDGSGAATAVDLAPDLDRPIANWVDSDLTGWMVSGRHGPVWIDATTIVATVSDQGRSRPHLFTLDARGRPTGHRPAVSGDIVTHTIAASARRGDGSATVAYLATDGPRAMELSTVELPGDQPRRRTRVGSAWQDRFALIEMRLVQATGAGGPIDVWMATLAGAADERLPTVVDVHGGPLGAWAPSPHVEVTLLASAGLPGRAPEHPGVGHVRW